MYMKPEMHKTEFDNELHRESGEVIYDEEKKNHKCWIPISSKVKSLPRNISIQ